MGEYRNKKVGNFLAYAITALIVVVTIFLIIEPMLST